MNHQPIDLWLHNPSALTPKQCDELQAHVETCVECRCIYTGWTASYEMIHAAGQVIAPTDFAARFQASLAERRAARNRRQVRIVLLILLSVLSIVSAILLVNFLSNHSPIQVIGQGIHFLSTAPQHLLQFQYIVSFWLGEIPAVYIIAAGIIICSWTFILLVSWVLTILRIANQGVRT